MNVPGKPDGKKNARHGSSKCLAAINKNLHKNRTPR